MDGPSSTSMTNRTKLAGAVAAIVSAFVVFVSGGIIVLSVWVSNEAEKKSTSVNQEVRKMIQAATKPESDKLKRNPTENKSPAAVDEKPEASRKKERSRRSSRRSSTSKVQTVVEVESPESKSSISVPEVEEDPKPGGRGNVMFVGDANRVRLLGEGMTFGAGSVPSGKYIIQATFPDSDPRNAGALVVRDGDRLRVRCDRVSKQCVRTK